MIVQVIRPNITQDERDKIIKQVRLIAAKMLAEIKNQKTTI